MGSCCVSLHECLSSLPCQLSQTDELPGNREREAAVKKTTSYSFFWRWANARCSHAVLHARIPFSSVTLSTSALAPAEGRRSVSECRMTKLSGKCQNLIAWDAPYSSLGLEGESMFGSGCGGDITAHCHEACRALKGDCFPGLNLVVSNSGYVSAAM